MRNVLCANESINFKNTNFKIAGRTQRRIVERLTAIGFAEPNVLVHPDRLALAARMRIQTENGLISIAETRRPSPFMYPFIRPSIHSPAADRDHLGVGRHEQLGAVAEALVALDAHPRVARALREQREQERLAGAEVRLPVALVVLQVALEPARRAVRPEHLRRTNQNKTKIG